MEKKDMKEHFDFLYGFFEKRNKTDSLKDSVYPWTGGKLDELESRRLNIQNEPFEGGWLKGHERFMAALREIIPEKGQIAVLGTGKDGSLLPVFSQFNRKTFVVEAEKERINGAWDSLNKRKIPLNDFEPFCGNAIELPELAMFDLVSSQCFWQHQATRPPFWLNAEAKSKFPTFRKIMDAVIDSLNRGGILAFTDLLMGHWNYEPGEGFENDESVMELVQRGRSLVHNQPGVLFFGWKTRGAYVWKTRDEIIETIMETAPGKLEFLPKPSFFIETDCRQDEYRCRLNTMGAYIVTTVTLAVQSALDQAESALKIQSDNQALKDGCEALRKSSDWLWKTGQQHLEILQDDRVLLIPPIMEYLAFRKIA